jgi:hypothetical protein
LVARSLLRRASGPSSSGHSAPQSPQTLNHAPAASASPRSRATSTKPALLNSRRAKPYSLRPIGPGP